MVTFLKLEQVLKDFLDLEIYRVFTKQREKLRKHRREKEKSRLRMRKESQIQIC